MFLRWNKTLVLLALLLAANLSQAIEIGDLELHGFISQSFMKTNGNKFVLTDSESGSFDFTEAGLSLHYQPWSRGFLSTMLLSRNFGDAETNEEDLTIDHLLVGFNLYSDENSELNFRVGRLKSPYGLYNETRDFPFSRSGVLLPQSMYFEDGRNLSLRTEGAELELSTSGAYGGIVLNWLYGRSTEEGDCLPIYETCSVDTDSRDIIRLIYDFPGNRLKFGASYFKVNGDAEGTITLGGLNNLTYWDKHYVSVQRKYLIYSLQYEGDDWVFSAEYSAPRETGYARATTYITDTNSGSTVEFDNNEWAAFSDSIRHYYIELQYHFNHQYSGFLRHGAYYPDKNDKEGSVPGGVGWYTPTPSYHDAYIAGATWNITEDMLLRGEYHYIEGAAHAVTEVDGDYDRYWGMFLMQFCIRF